MKISERLSFLRKQDGKTQEQMAALINKKRSTYQNYETGVLVPPIETLIIIADYYNVTLDYLCDHRTHDELGYLTDEQYEVIKLLIGLGPGSFNQAASYIRWLAGK